MDDPDAAATLTAAIPTIWPLTASVRLTLLTAGLNNLVYRVESAGDAPCILRIYRNYADLALVRHELALLAALRGASLPFAVPAPRATRAGVLVHQLRAGEAQLSGALAVLWTALAGAHPDPANEQQAEAAGAALALLDMALAQIDPAALPGRATVPLRDLRRRTSAPDDVEDVIRRLPLPAEDTASLVRQLHLAEEQIQPLYASLPRQLIHADFDTSNVLLDSARVTAVLDFEFAHIDLRIADLMIPLSWWHPELFGTGAEWGLMDAFGRGYTAHLPLLPDEGRALPILFRAHAIGGLLRRLGWHQRGRMSEQRVLARASYTLMRERWLQRNASRLVALAESWPHPR